MLKSITEQARLLHRRSCLSTSRSRTWTLDKTVVDLINKERNPNIAYLRMSCLCE